MHGAICQLRRRTTSERPPPEKQPPQSPYTPTARAPPPSAPASRSEAIADSVMGKARAAHGEHAHKDALDMYKRAAELYMKRLAELLANDADKPRVEKKARTALGCAEQLQKALRLYMLPLSSASVSDETGDKVDDLSLLFELSGYLGLKC